MFIAHIDSNGRELVSFISPLISPEQAASAMRLVPGIWRVVTDEEAAELQILSDTRTAQEKREEAYRMEADIFRDRAISYRTEMEACRLDGAKKEEIRALYPDAGDERYCLNTSGTYHAPTCNYVGENGQALTLAEIAARNPAAKPCSRCAPPALPGEGESIGQ